MIKNTLLIIGSLPPPIGGVTIHVKRLLGQLTTRKIRYKFVELRKDELFFNLFKFKVVHLHTSNPILRAFISIILFPTKIKLIITYHGSLGRFNNIYNFFDFLSIKLSTIPIILNEDSLKIAIKYNRKAIKLTSFIPPIENEKLDEDLVNFLNEINKNYRTVYSTNASHLSYDKNGNEIYGILDLINMFNDYQECFLLISDPKGDYKRYIEKENVSIPRNIHLVSYEHSFYEIIKLSDCIIRNTSTDGDAISIKEALYLKKQVFATNVVSRDSNVIQYDFLDYTKLSQLIINFEKQNIVFEEKNLIEDLINIYKN